MKSLIRNILFYKLLIANCLLPIALCLFLISFSSCKKDSFCNCLKSTGSTATEKRDLATFNKIEIDKNIDVFLVQDSVSYAKVTCGKNLLDGVSTEVSEGRLTITNKNKCNWSRSFKNEFVVEVHCAELMEIIFSTSGDLTMLNQFKVDSLYMQSDIGSGSILMNLDSRIFYGVLNTGVADLTVKGKVGGNYLLANGQGFIDTSELENGYAYLRSNATNDCKVRVTGQLDVEIEAIGNIYYYGDPHVVNLIKHSGTGKLIKAD
ncbi:MAG: DUF2807 domain-containing protein [Bacteroidia bacterium]